MAKSDIQKMMTKLGDWSLPSLWCTQHRLIGGKPMRFYSEKDLLCHRPFLIAPVDDMSKEVVVQKSRQLGFTEAMLSKASWLASLVGVIIVYTMPKGDKAKEIARERLDPMGYRWSNQRFSDFIIDNVLVNWKDSTLHKHFSPLYGGGRSSILVQSAWKGDAGESTGESTAGDFLFLDEYDRINQQVEAAFDQSLSSSRFGVQHAFSTPTYPNQGIDKKFKASDRKSYLYKCQNCGFWQPLRRTNILQKKGSKDLVKRLETHDDSAVFPVGTFIIGCLKCGKELDRHHCKSEWVAETTSDVSGYRVSKLDFVKHTADSIMVELRKTGPGLEPWMWYVMGEAYLGEYGRLEEDWIYSIVDATFPVFKSGKEFREKYPNSIIGFGADWGVANWYIVKAKIPNRDLPIIIDAGFFYDEDLGETSEAKQEAAERSGKRMADIAELWSPNGVVADFGFGKDRNPYLYRKFGYKFYACDYTGKMNTTIPAWGKNPPPIAKSIPIVKIDRDTTLEAILMDTRLQRFAIAPIEERILKVIDQHFRNIVIRIYTDEKGEIQKEAKDIGDDHFIHADNYADIALLLAKRSTMAVGEINADEHPKTKLQRVLEDEGYGRFDIMEQLMFESEFHKLL